MSFCRNNKSGTNYKRCDFDCGSKTGISSLMSPSLFVILSSAVFINFSPILDSTTIYITYFVRAYSFPISTTFESKQNKKLLYELSFIKTYQHEVGMK